MLTPEHIYMNLNKDMASLSSSLFCFFVRGSGGRHNTLRFHSITAVLTFYVRAVLISYWGKLGLSWKTNFIWLIINIYNVPIRQSMYGPALWSRSRAFWSELEKTGDSQLSMYSCTLLESFVADFAVCDWWRWCDEKLNNLEGNGRTISHIELSISVIR